MLEKGKCLMNSPKPGTRKLLAGLLLAACSATMVFTAACRKTSRRAGQLSSEERTTADVNESRVIAADKEPGNWMTYGRTYDEQRFSPLKQITDQNVSQLGLAWHFDLDTHRGQEATPLVIDGVMYFTSAWSKVFALNAATGAQLWSFDPKVDPAWAVNACCDVVNRGVAGWNGKVFVGTLDGRLIALDAASGNKLWDVQTTDPSKRYTITGAPRVIKGKVIIGNGGAEMGVRGYVSAYGAEDGKLAWRFYTVPGNPSQPFENPVLEKAAKTWSGEWWKNGGGGTVWDSMAYDPGLDLMYIGTGNGDPWPRQIRDPRKQDNLFTCSIVALKPETGEYVWHYQENPGDQWDYDSDEQIILADLKIDGEMKHVLMHAPKNGFFYLLERATGKLLSARPFAQVTWATGIDIQSGRPVESAAAEYRGRKGPALVSPGPGGAHSWQPGSFDPQTGLVYFPVMDAGFPYKTAEHFRHNDFAWNNGIDPVAAGMPQDPKIKQMILAGIKGQLTAWDPIQQKEIWRAERSEPWNGGALSTAGNLVFEGTESGTFEAFRATTGEKLWSASTQSGVTAAPIAYSVNGEEYVAVLVGWGGVLPLAAGEVGLQTPRLPNTSRMLAFKIGGTASLPPAPEPALPALASPQKTADAAAVKKGEALYQRYCSPCHGDVAVSGGVLPDLRYSKMLARDQWMSIVIGGALRPAGMISFAKELTPEDALAIRDYMVFRANQSFAETGTAVPR